MARHKDVNWTLPDRCQDWHQVAVSVLMDIRDELKNINRRLDCNTTLQAALSALASSAPKPEGRSGLGTGSDDSHMSFADQQRNEIAGHKRT